MRRGRGFASSKQATAYREVKRLEHEAHLRKAYGMLPIRARHPGLCGCRRHDDQKFGTGDLIVKFRGAWWTTHCVDEVKLAEWRATASFVREILTHDGWKAFDWSDDPRRAEIWEECLAADPNPRERVTRR